MPISITEGIRVSVRVEYLRSSVNSIRRRHIFVYHINIENNSTSPIHILGRHWTIQDALLHAEEIDGEGIVGQKPHLSPGASFDYTSYCPLSTEWGSMYGHYIVERPDKSTFSVAIPSFALLTPGLLN